MSAPTDRAGDLIDRLPSATLADVTADAALLTRTDRKYVLAEGALPEVVAGLLGLDPGLRVLEVEGHRRSRYDSTYLDTPGLESYARAARARRHRFKVRTRRYVDSGSAFTEVKTRSARGATVKARLPRHTPEGCELPLERDGAFVGAVLTRVGLGHVDVAGLVPALHTRYVRTTLWLPASHARVTIDVDLTWGLPWERTGIGVPGLAVVEVKTTGPAARVDRVLWRRGHRPVRISKYGTGLALLLPDLPAHRWHRVLTHHLRPRAQHLVTQESA